MGVADETVVDVFRATATRLPEAAALVYFDRSITHRELDRASDAFAAGLQALGFDAGDRVALYMQNLPQFVIGLLGTWKAGGVGVPINPMDRSGEVKEQLNDSGAVALLAGELHWKDVGREAVRGTAVRIAITTDELDRLDGRPPTLASTPRHRPNDTDDFSDLLRRFAARDPTRMPTGSDTPALLTYTLGTSRPATGAIHTHGNLVFGSSVYQRWGALSERDVALGMSPLFHITGLVAHMCLTLLTGMPLVLFGRFEARTALQLIERHRVTFVIGATTAYAAMSESPRLADTDLSSLTKLLIGGAALPAATLATLGKSFGRYIHNAYGPMETTSPSHMVPFEARAPVDAESGALSVGLPVPAIDVRLARSNGDDAAVGEAGEIQIRGPQAISGRWRRADESERALPDGWLHTGDIGKIDNDGWFYVICRKKDQTSASGFKIWPREVEEVLSSHQAVAEAAVMGLPDAHCAETVKAFVVLERGRNLSADELIAFCRTRLAVSQIPHQLEFVHILPKTMTGKFLRPQLRDWGRAPGMLLTIRPEKQ